MFIYKSKAAAEVVETKYSELLRHWPIEKENREVETRHGRTAIIACGQPDKPPLLLFHPGNSNSVFWLNQVRTYAGSHRVFAIDIIGEAGRSDTNRPRFRGAAYAEWIEDIFSELKLDSAALVGAGLGAWMCLNFACARPEKVERLALISPPGIVRARRTRSAVTSLASRSVGPFGRRLILRSQLKKSDMDPRLKELMALTQRHLKQRPTQLPRFSPRQLRQLFCPVLVLVGGQDAYFDTDRLILRLVKALPQVEVHFRAREGHFPSDFTREVDRFLVTHYAPE